MARKIERLPVPYDDLFDDETPPVMIKQSEAISEEEIDEEVEAIDKMLNGDDEDFDRLEY